MWTLNLNIRGDQDHKIISKNFAIEFIDPIKLHLELVA